MKCKNCKLDVAGTPKRCPLCQGDLTGEPQESTQIFPYVPPQKSGRLFLSILGFISVVICVVCFAVNLSFPGRWWSLFVLGGMVSFWTAFALVIQKKGNVHKTIVWQVVLISGIALAWDFATGFHLWSVNFVVPIVCSLALIAMAIMGKVLKLSITDYMIYVLLDCVFGLVSLILLLCGAVTVTLPSIICFAGSIIFLAALLIFEGKSLRSELNRRMHI